MNSPRSIARRELKKYHETRVRETLRTLQAPVIVTVVDLQTLLTALASAEPDDTDWLPPCAT